MESTNEKLIINHLTTTCFCFFFFMVFISVDTFAAKVLSSLTGLSETGFGFSMAVDSNAWDEGTPGDSNEFTSPQQEIGQFMAPVKESDLEMEPWMYGNFNSKLKNGDRELIDKRKEDSYSELEPDPEPVLESWMLDAMDLRSKKIMSFL